MLWFHCQKISDKINGIGGMIMKLEEKIMLLRKQRGWSQEELAAQMDVSRQSVSKWESGLSIPDIDKIILLSKIFGTTTDYLLKDEVEDGADIRVNVETEKEINLQENISNERFYKKETKNEEKKEDIQSKHVSRMEAEEYIAVMKNASKRIAFGVLLCILSPVPMMFLSALGETGKYGIGEDVAGIIGVCVLLLIVAGATAILVPNVIKMSKWDFIEKQIISLDTDVVGEYKEKSEQFVPIFARNMAIGVVLCIVAVVPMMLAAINDESDAPVIAMTGVLLIFVALGVYRFVKVGIIKDSYDKLLGQGDYTKEDKINKKKNDTFSGVYWLIVTAIYLAYSFRTMEWKSSWIIWPVAGVLFAAITMVMNAMRDKK